MNKLKKWVIITLLCSTLGFSLATFQMVRSVHNEIAMRRIPLTLKVEREMASNYCYVGLLLDLWMVIKSINPSGDCAKEIDRNLKQRTVAMGISLSPDPERIQRRARVAAYYGDYQELVEKHVIATGSGLIANSYSLGDSCGDLLGFALLCQGVKEQSLSPKEQKALLGTIDMVKALSQKCGVTHDTQDMFSSIESLVRLQLSTSVIDLKPVADMIVIWFPQVIRDIGTVLPSPVPSEQVARIFYISIQSVGFYI